LFDEPLIQLVELLQFLLGTLFGDRVDGVTFDSGEILVIVCWDVVH